MTDDEGSAVDCLLNRVELLSARDNGLIGSHDPDDLHAIALLCGRVKAASAGVRDAEDVWLYSLADAIEALLLRGAVPRPSAPVLEGDGGVVDDFAKAWCGWTTVLGVDTPPTVGPIKEVVKRRLGEIADESRAKINDYEAGRITAEDYREFMNRVHAWVKLGRPMTSEKKV